MRPPSSPVPTCVLATGGFVPSQKEFDFKVEGARGVFRATTKTDWSCRANARSIRAAIAHRICGHVRDLPMLDYRSQESISLRVHRKYRPYDQRRVALDGHRVYGGSFVSVCSKRLYFFPHSRPGSSGLHNFFKVAVGIFCHRFVAKTDSECDCEEYE